MNENIINKTAEYFKNYAVKELMKLIEICF